MKFCSCGQITDEKSAQCPGCEALHVLGLEITAAENEIRSAYHQFVRVLSPDNFQNDPALKEAADGKLKNIQTAFDFLMSTSTERSLQPRPIYLASSKVFEEASPKTESTTASTNSATPEAAANPNSSGLLPKINWNHSIFGWLLRIAAVVFVLLVGSMIWTAFKDQSHGDKQAANVDSSGETASVAHVPTKTQAGPQNKPSAAHVIKSYLTLGSTREEVLAQQGPPTASSEDKLVYGKSELYLKDGSVVGWRIDSAANPIRVKLWPHSAVSPDLKSYTVGSSKDEVLVIQGTPTAFTDETFEYGRSIVYFHDNRVTHWKEDPASVTLWAR